MTDPTSTIIDTKTLIGTTISERYAVRSVLGDGSMGVVFLAEHTHMKKKVALKVMKPEFLDNPEAVERFQREAQATGHIEHPHVCAATDFGRLDDERFFLVMEYLDGTTLGDLLDKEHRLNPARAVKIVRQIASGLQRAHELEVVHRDLKPDNVILVDREGDPDFVKITDFGVARVEVVDAQNLTRAGTTMGTPVYMSPEQAVAARADARSDLYSLGIMMFEMLAGEVPFYSQSLAVILSMHANEAPPLMHDVAPEAMIPRDLGNIVAKLLEKDADDRFQSAVELIEALDAADLTPYVEGLPAPSSPAEPQRPPPPIPSRPASAPESAPESAAESAPESGDPTTAATAVDVSGADMFASSSPEIPVVLPPPTKPGLASQWGAAPAAVRYGIAFVVLLTLAIPLMAAAIMFVTFDRAGGGGTGERGMAFSEEEVRPEDLEDERAEFLENVDLDETLPKMAPAAAVAALQPLLAEHGTNAHLRYLLGVATADDGHPADAMEHYLAAVGADPRYTRDTRLISDVQRLFGDTSNDVAAPATPVMLALLSAEGAQVQGAVFDLGIEGSWNARKRARDLLKSANKWDGLQEWQRDAISLGMMGKDDCSRGLNYVKSIAKAGDPGALPALKKASRRSKDGCGVFKNQDCYKCLRGEVGSAIKKLEAVAKQPKAPEGTTAGGTTE